MMLIKSIHVDVKRKMRYIEIVRVSDKYAAKQLAAKKVPGIFDKTAYTLYLPVSPAEVEMWDRNVHLRNYPGGLMRMIEHAEEVETMSRWGYLTWYTALPNRHQRKHDAAWELANELDEK